MTKLKTPLEVYKLLQKSNCGQCGISTCMAFAAAVIKQEKQLAECPHLDADLVRRYGGNIEQQVNIETIQKRTFKDLQEQIRSIDIISSAERLGARGTSSTIVVTCLGKDFEVDTQGRVLSSCHSHAWFSIPLLTYVLYGRGASVTGKWVPFRELEKGRMWERLFERRCEAPLKRIADAHAELFEDLISMFSGAYSPDQFASDISMILYPLPKVPILICYWKAEEGMDSKLHVFFDATADQNLTIDSLFTLGTGFVRMLEKIMHKHTDGKSELS
jgi:hypothetical protein